MSIIGKFTRRSMKSHRKWTVVTIIGVVISTAMITAVSSFASSFFDLLSREAIADNGNWHAIISSVKMSEVPTLEKASFVGSVSLSRDLGYALLTGSQNKNKPYLFIKQYDQQSTKSYPVKLVEGRMPKNAHEIVLSQHIQTNGGVKIHVGETLTLQMGRRQSAGDNSSELGQDTPYQGKPSTDSKDDASGERFEATGTQTFTVVGIMERPSYEPTWAPGYTAFTYLDAAALSPVDTVNAALLVKRPGHSIYADVDALTKKVGLSPQDNVKYNSELLRYSGVFAADNTQNTLYEFMAVIIAIIAIASISLIYNAFAISVSERTRQLGMLASVGATRAQKRRSVYLEGFYIGLFGIPLGVLAGIAGIGITLAAIRPLMASFMNLNTDGLRLCVSPDSIAAAVLLAVLTIFISAWLPARRASRIMPIDAIRQSKEVKLSARTVKTSRLTRCFFGFEGELALKNLKRSRRKYRATVVSLVVSLVLFLTASYYPAFTKATSNATEDVKNFDVVASFSERDPQTQQTLQTIAGFDTVTQSARTQFNSSGVFALDTAQTSDTFRKLVKSQSKGVYRPSAVVYSYDRAAFEAFAKSIGVDPAPLENTANPSGILINAARENSGGVYVSGEELTVKAGDTLHYEIQNETAKSKAFSSSFAVGAVTDALPIGIARLSFSNVQLVVCENVFDAFQAKMPEGLRNEAMMMYLKTTDGTKLESQIRELPTQPSVYNIATVARSERNINLVFEIFIFGFITLISLICIANMFNTITTNIALRRREFAMLRSVGMTPRGFGRMIRYESMLYGLNALLWGLPISFGIGLLLNNFASSTISTGFVFPWKNYLAAVVLLFLIVTVTMLYASAKSKNENIVDALTGEDL
ncbi:MAG: FtsX-like permease family protein [Clostridia bacterium]|nr:FtsX-like permease family protein [Clostridia bacterium]